MKKKILGAFLTAAFIPSILCSCGRDAPSDSQYSAVSEIVETTESITTCAPTKAIVEETTEPQTETQSDFDFVKTVESTYICGQKLSYPITWGQFGDDFTIVSDGLYINSEKQKVTADVNYKDHYLGHFIFYGCDSVETITEDTVITAIFVYDNDLDYFGISKIAINGLCFGADHSRLFDALGDDFREGVGYDQIIYENDDGKYIFTFGLADDEDKIISVNLFNLIK